MSTSPRMRIPYPDRAKDPWHESFVDMVNAMDAALHAGREDRNLVLMGGGMIGFDGTTLSWSAPLEILAPTTGFLWRVATGSIDLEDGQMLYTNLTRSPSDTTAVTVAKAAIVPASDSALLLAIRRGDRIYFRNGDVLRAGQTLDIIESGGGEIAPGDTAEDTGLTSNGGSEVTYSRSDHVHRTALAVRQETTQVAAVSRLDVYGLTAEYSAGANSVLLYPDPHRYEVPVVLNEDVTALGWSVIGTYALGRTELATPNQDNLEIAFKLLAYTTSTSNIEGEVMLYDLTGGYAVKTWSVQSLTPDWFFDVSISGLIPDERHIYEIRAQLLNGTDPDLDKLIVCWAGFVFTTTFY